MPDASIPSSADQPSSTPGVTGFGHEPAQFDPVAGLLAILVPGLGYLYLGDLRRALYVGAGVLGLFVGGLLVGGISVVDRRNDQWWFLLQCGVGPVTFAVNHINTGYMNMTQGGPSPNTAYRRSLGRVYEVGALSAGIAGMMNLIAIIDCFWHAPITRRERRKEPLPTL